VWGKEFGAINGLKTFPPHFSAEPQKMTRILSIANKLLSLRGRMEIADEQGAPAYEARGEFALLVPIWRISRNEQEVATVRRKIFAWAPTWIIQCGPESFLIQRKLLSWTRQYHAVGGSYDGAVVKGNIWALSFRVARGPATLATASGKILTLRDRHNVEIFGEGELFVVIAMVVLHIDRREARLAADD
jgi:uncharacterized protein YxjI